MLTLLLLACTTPDDPKDTADTAAADDTDTAVTDTAVTDTATTDTADTSDTDTIDTGETDIDDTSDTGETDTTTDTSDTVDTSDTADTGDTGAEPTCDTTAVLECDGPAPCGYAVEQMMLGGSAPTMTGGTLNPGAYVITSYSSYDPTRDSSWSRGTGVMLDYLMIFDDDGTVRLAASVDAGGSSTIQAASGTWSTADGILSIALTCPVGPDAEPLPYTATTDTLDFGNNDVYITAIRVGDP